MGDTPKSGSPTPWFQLPSRLNKAHDVTIIGAGLAGSSAAHHLAMSGKSVTVLDQNSTVAEGASGNPVGLFEPQVNSDNSYVTNYLNNYYQYFTGYIQNLLKENEIPSHRLCGINRIDLSSSEPRWELIENAGIISPSDLCKVQLKHAGIKVITCAKVDNIIFDDNHWLCLNSSGELLSRSVILVIANGYQGTAFRQTRMLEMSPLAGQISYLETDAISPPVKQPCAGKHYLIPLTDGSYLCGASHHRTAQLMVNQTDHEENILGLKAMLSKHRINPLKISGGRTGVRCVTPDHLPMVGAVPDASYYAKHYDSLHHGRKAAFYPHAQYQQGLFIITGLGSHGISSSPYLGKLLSSMIIAELSEVDIEIATLLHPARFLIREYRKKPADRKSTITLR